jgi:excisionase family DNA binding protein
VTPPEPAHDGSHGAGAAAPGITWLSTAEAAGRLGITPRTLYRFIDEGQIPAYRFGRVIRLKLDEVDRFIDACRIEPGTLEHLYPEVAGDGRRSE